MVRQGLDHMATAPGFNSPLSCAHFTISTLQLKYWNMNRERKRGGGGNWCFYMIAIPISFNFPPHFWPFLSKYEYQSSITVYAICGDVLTLSCIQLQLFHVSLYNQLQLQAPPHSQPHCTTFSHIHVTTILCKTAEILFSIATAIRITVACHLYYRQISSPFSGCQQHEQYRLFGVKNTHGATDKELWC